MLSKFVDSNLEFDAAAAATAYLTPRGRRRIFRQIDAGVECTKSKLEFDGEQLGLRFWGQGDKVLLVHGWSGCQSDMYDFVPALVKSGVCAVALDLPAHGESTGKLTSLESCGAAIRACVRYLGSVSGIIAHSFGCTATALAISQGMQLKRLVFISPSESYEGYAQRFAKGRGFDEQQTKLMLDALTARGIRLPIFSSELAAEFNLPGIIVCSEDDDVTPIALSRRIAEVWKQSALIAVDGLGHRKILQDQSIVETCVTFVSNGKNSAQMEQY